MDVDLIRKFQGQYVKLVLGDRYFKIDGFLDQVSDSFVLFRTTEKTSIINVCEIREIHLLNKGGSRHDNFQY